MQEFPSEGLVGREANVDLPGKDGCCWTATAPETSYPALSGKQRVEVAIVGGGIAGLSAAPAQLTATADSGREVRR
jgi:hypothetical protein